MHLHGSTRPAPPCEARGALRRGTPWALAAWVALAAWTGGGGIARAAPVLESEHWFALLLQGKPCGHMRSTQRRDAERGLLMTRQEMRIEVARAGQVIKIEMSSAFTETLDHRPVSASTRQDLGTMRIVQNMAFLPDALVLTSEQNGVVSERRLKPLQGAWLTPAAAGLEMERRLKAGEKSFSVASVDALAGPVVVTTEVQVEGRETIEVLGKSVPALRLKQRQSLAPGQVMTTWVDDAGEPLRAEVSLLPGLSMTVLRADEQTAKLKVQPAELLLQTLIAIEKPIERPRSLKRAVYRLDLAGEGLSQAERAALLASIPSSGPQRVERMGEGGLRVTVDLRAAPEAPPEAQPGPEHLEASVMMNWKDPEVAALAQRALREVPPGASKAQQAEALRRFVHRHIRKKDLGVAFATAGEVARTGQGDCTEHGVLLGALLRARGIPSRAVTGLLYADEFVGQKQVFGYHLWTQAWLSEPGAGAGRWVDLDAVLPDDAPSDATHIALSHSPMSDERGMMSLAEAAGLINRLKLRVEQSE